VPPAPTAPQPQAWGTPPPAAPVPPGPGAGWNEPPARPPKKRRLTWLWLLIPLMLVLVASTVVVIVFAVKLFTEPIDATNSFYADLRDARYEAAYAKLCDPAQRAFSEADFVADQERVESDQGRITDFDFDDVQIGDDDDFRSDVIDATVEGEIVRGGQRYEVTVGLQRDDGEWKVCASTRG
jgi:hypothetical protein